MVEKWCEKCYTNVMIHLDTFQTYRRLVFDTQNIDFQWNASLNYHFIPIFDTSTLFVLHLNI